MEVTSVRAVMDIKKKATLVTTLMNANTKTSVKIDKYASTQKEDIIAFKTEQPKVLTRGYAILCPKAHSCAD